MLAVLQNLNTYVNSEQEHIGITNVVLRLRQIFPDAAFTFCNRSGAGAQITIDFPYVPFSASTDNRNGKKYILGGYHEPVNRRR